MAHSNGPTAAADEFHDGITLLGLYQLPKHLRRAIAEETRVYTLKEPPKFFGKSAVSQPARGESVARPPENR